MWSRTNFSNIIIVILIVISSGCLSLTVTQDLKMDGTSDIDIEAEGNELALKSFENRLNSSIVELKNAKVEKEEYRYIYSYKNIPANLENTDNLEELDIDIEYNRNPGFIYDKFRLEIDSEGNSGINGNSIFTGFMSEEPKIEYRLNYFGTLQSTNGELKHIEGNKYVVFDLSEKENYFVEFKAMKPRLIYANFRSEEPCGNPIFEGNYSQKC